MDFGGGLFYGGGGDLHPNFCESLLEGPTAGKAGAFFLAFASISLGLSVF
jgi:hypothetical protein